METEKTSTFVAGYDAESRHKMCEAFAQWMQDFREGKNPKASALSYPSAPGVTVREPLFHD